MPTTAGIFEDPIEPRELGHAELVPVGEFEAGSYQTFTLTYHLRIFRHRRLRKPARRFPIRGRPDPPAVRRSEGTQLHDGRRQQQRGSGIPLRPQGQHPALGPHPLRKGRPRLHEKGRHHHHHLRRYQPGLTRHAPADILRGYVRVPRPGRPYRHLQLPAASGPADDQADPGTGGPLGRGLPDVAKCR